MSKRRRDPSVAIMGESAYYRSHTAAESDVAGLLTAGYLRGVIDVLASEVTGPDECVVCRGAFTASARDKSPICPECK